MIETTPNFTLPYILASQAQKHITHNEALRQLDGLIALTIVDTLSSPPVSPTEGESYLIASSPTDAWLGKAGMIANFVDAAWQYFTPKTGWSGWFVALGQRLVFDGADWVNPASTGSLGMLGVNATPDATNRLSLSSPASLFNHAGNGHQIKLNKAAAGDTASVLFQTNWSGRAEMGTAGSDSFLFKISPDGSSWNDALLIDPNGVVTMPQRPFASASLTAGVITPTAGEQSGFDTLDINQGGMALGSALASGHGASLVVPVSGTYSLAFNAKIQPTAAFAMQLVANGSTVLATASSDMAESGYLSFSAFTIATLTAGDALSFLHTGSANMMAGAGETHLAVTML